MTVELHKAFWVEDNWQAERLLIMTPYFTPAFCAQLVRALRPARILLIVDDGASNASVDQLLEEIIDAAPKRPKASITVLRSAAEGGLVHAKLIHLQFGSTTGRGPKKRRVVFGSANASEAGFNPSKNAEIIGSQDYRQNDAEKFHAYVESLWAAEGRGGASISAASAQLGDLSVNLPNMRLRAHVPVAPPSQFMAWLQRGRLLAKYDPMSSFLRFVLRLEQPLPGAPQIPGSELVLEEQNTASFSVLPPDEGQEDAPFPDPVDEDENQHFRRKAHTVWTVYGDWISEAAYNDLGRFIQRKGMVERRDKLRRFQNFLKEPDEISKRCGALTDAIREFSLAIDQKIVPTFFRWKRNDIDYAHYADLLRKKIARDEALMTARDFEERYVHGYEINGVPKMDLASPEWEAFVRSWCETVAFEVGRPRSHNLVARFFRDRATSDPALRESLDAGDLSVRLVEAVYGPKLAHCQMHSDLIPGPSAKNE